MADRGIRVTESAVTTVDRYLDRDAYSDALMRGTTVERRRGVIAEIMEAVLLARAAHELHFYDDNGDAARPAVR